MRAFPPAADLILERSLFAGFSADVGNPTAVTPDRRREHCGAEPPAGPGASTSLERASNDDRKRRIAMYPQVIQCETRTNELAEKLLLDDEIRVARTRRTEARRAPGRSTSPIGRLLRQLLAGTS